MQRRKKEVLATICLGVTVLTLIPAVSWAETAAIPVICQQETEIAPYMLLINRVECDLDITGTTATAKCYVTGDPNAATKAKIIAELQVKNGSSWIPVKIWTVTEDSYSARVKENYTITQGNTYRLKATMTVWEGSQSETQIVYSS